MLEDGAFDLTEFDEFEDAEGLEEELTSPPDRGMKGWMGWICSTLFVGVLGMTPTEDAEAATYTVTNNNDSGPGSLRQAVLDANANPGADTIDFSAVPSPIVLTSGEIAITESVTITGPGSDSLTIDGNANDRIFYIDDGDWDTRSNITISGLTLTNGNAAGFGGAIRDRGENNTFDDVVITGNTASDDGGGVYSEGGSVIIRNSTISNNTSGDDGGGLALVDDIALIENCTISGNKADDDGGGVFTDDMDTLLVKDSTISDNEAGLSGSPDDGNGGGLEINSPDYVATLVNCTISGNTANEDGGGVRADNFRVGGGTTLDNCSITGNTANGYYSDAGGVDCDDDGFLVIRNNTAISYNTAHGEGGGVFFEGAGNSDFLTIENSSIFKNTVDGGGGPNEHGDGGGVFFNSYDAVLTVSDSTITGNSAARDGGGIGFLISDPYGYGPDGKIDGNVNLTNVTITGNEAGDDGGGFSFRSYYGSDSAFTVEDCTISSNTAFEDGGGARLSIEGGRTHGTILFRNTVISDNITSEADEAEGGGIRLKSHGSDAPFILDHCTITGNSAAERGGGVDIDCTQYPGLEGGVRILACTVSGNTAADEGGGIWVGDRSYGYGNAPVVISDTTISNNTATTQEGGGIWFDIYYSFLVAKNCTISGNQAELDGGGVFFEDDSGRNASGDNAFLNCTITGNRATTGNGGGVAFDTYDEDIEFGSSIVSGNTAGGTGPDLYVGAYYSYVEPVFSLISDSSGFTINNNDSSNILDTDAMLGPLADNGGPTQTHALLAGSPALNAGFNSVGALFDQRGEGFPRTDGQTDMGAYEAHAPTDILLSNNTVQEGSPVGTAIGDFSAVDADTSDTHTYQLVAGDGDTDNASFQIVGNTLQTNAVIGETPSVFSIRVEATDSTGLTFEKVFTIVLIELPDPTVFGVGPDADGDGFSDSLEAFSGSDPNDPASTPMGIAANSTEQLLVVKKLRINLMLNPDPNFTGKDRIRFLGELPIPDGFTFAGQQVIVDIGGVQKNFTLNAQGRGTDGNVVIRFTRPRRGFSRVIVARRFRGDFKGTLDTSSDLSNVTAKKEPRTVHLTILFNGAGYVKDQDVRYTARQNHFGNAKSPRP